MSKIKWNKQDFLKWWNTEQIQKKELALRLLHSILWVREKSMQSSVYNMSLFIWKQQNSHTHTLNTHTHTHTHTPIHTHTHIHTITHTYIHSQTYIYILTLTHTPLERKPRKTPWWQTLGRPPGGPSASERHVAFSWSVLLSPLEFCSAHTSHQLQITSQHRKFSGCWVM